MFAFCSSAVAAQLLKLDSYIKIVDRSIYRKLALRFAIFLFLPGTISLPASAQQQTFESLSFPLSLSLRRITLPAQNNIITISLPDSFVIANSDTLRCETQLLQRNADYVFNYRDLKLTVYNTSTSCDSLIFTYHILPINLPRKFSLFQLVTLKPDSIHQDKLQSTSIIKTTPLNSQQFRLNQLGSKLSKRGSITRGISLGNQQALQVDSGLRIQLAGELAEGVEILASLTDQNTPIQPEGNTQTLREIDKVSIQLKSKQFAATLGDFEIAYGNSEFSRYNRKLQGAMFQLGSNQLKTSHLSSNQTPNFHFIISGAVSRGLFTTNEFIGIEGNQGPYQLKGDRGQIDIIVLAGTERVWIDGVRITRGESSDYVIDYSLGQITFTRNRLITADSRITIDFQYSDERFRRSLFSTQGKVTTLNDKLTLQATWLQEGDDKDDPLSFSLAQTELDSLAAAGDGIAFRSGARLIEPPDKGRYIKQDSIFVFVGQDSGNYEVTFSDVGEDNGDYQFVSSGRFDFVGKNKGRYLPVILLTPAQRHQVFDNRIEYSPAKGISLINEIAISRLDRNLYSSLDDSDNTGQAWLTSLDVQERSVSLGKTKLGKIGLQLKYRNKNERYRDIDRSDVVEFNRRWNLPDSQKTRRENILESELRYSPFSSLKFHGNLGSLKLGSLLKSERWETGTALQKKRLAIINL